MKRNVSTPLGLLLFAMLSVASCQKEPATIQEGQNKGTNSELMTTSALAGSKAQIGINVLLNTSITDAIINDLKLHGTVLDVFPQIKGLTMRIASNDLSIIRNLKYVSAANPDAERQGSPVDPIEVADFSDGRSTWNLDAVNVTETGTAGRTVAQDGSGVYIGVLDTGLPDSWRQYFPQERIATQYAKSFGGGGGEQGNVSEQPNKWEHDQNTHGGHVTSTIIGFQLGSTFFNGVAPKATIIPVKVLNQNGSGWSSVVAQGMLYIASLKSGTLKNSPVVINMSLGGPGLDPFEKAAIDYAIKQGVIIVASAGNEGDSGMGYPGAYAPVISAAAAGLVNQFTTPTWWFTYNVPDPTNVNDFFIAPFSSRELAGQDLDVAAPGVSVVGPYQLNSGQLSYYYLSGTSMASPHVAGIVALMAQKNGFLTASQAETTLESAAIPMGAGSRVVNGVTISWGSNATGSGLITADAALAAVK
jgi:subtilisin family serine protease